MLDYLNLNVITNFVLQLHPHIKVLLGLWGCLHHPVVESSAGRHCDALGAIQTRTRKVKNLPFVPEGIAVWGGLSGCVPKGVTR